MTPEQIEQMRADDAAGTPGPWLQTCESIDPDWHIVTTVGGAVVANVFAPQSANARRIARVPDMEAHILAQAVEIARLREALAEFADPRNWFDVLDEGDPFPAWRGEFLPPEDLAQKALKGETP